MAKKRHITGALKALERLQWALEEDPSLKETAIAAIKEDDFIKKNKFITDLCTYHLYARSQTEEDFRVVNSNYEKTREVLKEIGGKCPIALGILQKHYPLQVNSPLILSDSIA